MTCLLLQGFGQQFPQVGGFVVCGDECARNPSSFFIMISLPFQSLSKSIAYLIERIAAMGAHGAVAEVDKVTTLDAGIV